MGFCRFLLTTVVVLIVAIMVALLITSDEVHLLEKGDLPGLITLSRILQPNKPASTEQTASKYSDRFSKSETQDPEMVDAFYNIVTDFYEYGWGHSFHFAHTQVGESHDDSIRRHEHRLADKLGLKPGMKVIDIGCGVGGPARAIANYSKAHVTGVTINGYQVAKGNNHTKKAGLENLVTLVQGDFHNLEFPEASFDAAYAIESTCHARKLEDVYKEAFRVVKPGGFFGSYEWISTPQFNPSNPEHMKAKILVEKGNALPPLRIKQDVINAAKTVGFEILEEYDYATDKVNTIPWYNRLDMNKFARWGTHLFCVITEFLGFSPKGTVATHQILLDAADGLILGGQLETFTPMHFFLMKKPAA